MSRFVVIIHDRPDLYEIYKTVPLDLRIFTEMFAFIWIKQ